MTCGCAPFLQFTILDVTLFQTIRSILLRSSGDIGGNITGNAVLGTTIRDRNSTLLFVTAAAVNVDWLHEQPFQYIVGNFSAASNTPLVQGNGVSDGPQALLQFIVSNYALLPPHLVFVDGQKCKNNEVVRPLWSNSTTPR